MPPDIASLGIKVDSKEVKIASKDLDKLTTAGGKTEKSVKRLTSSSHLLKKALAVVSVAAITAGIVSIGKASLQAASDLEETQGKFDVVFRGMTATSEAWAKTLQDSYIMSREESKRYLSSLQDLLVPTGLAREAAGAMAFEFVKLAGDLASFNNMPTSQVIRDIQSALAGGSETMTKYGVDVKVAAIKQEALNLGLIKGKEVMNKQARAMALLSLSYKDSADAVGDLGRTFPSAANQVKRFTADMSDLKTEIGDALLPVVTATITDFNRWYGVNEKIITQDIVEYIDDMATAIDTVVGYTKKVITASQSFKDVLDEIASYGGPSYGDWGLIGFALFKGGVQAGLLAGTLVAINNALGQTHHNLMQINAEASADGSKSLVRYLLEVGDSINAWGTNEVMDPIEAQINAVNKELVATKASLKEIEDLTGFRKVLNDLAGGQDDIEFYTKKIAELKDLLIELNQDAEDNAFILSSFSDAVMPIDDATKAFNKAFDASGLLTDAITGLGDEYEATQAKIKQAMEGVNTILATSGMSDYEVSLFDINKEYDALLSNLKKLGASQDELQIVEIARSIEIEEKRVKNQQKIHNKVFAIKKKLAAEQLAVDKKFEDDAKDLAEKRLDIYNQMFDQMEHTDEESLIHQKQLLNKQYIEYDKYIDDKVFLNKWYHQENEKLEKEAAKASDDLWSGFQAGILDAIKNSKTLGQVGFDSIQTFRSGIKDSFVSIFKGEFDEIGNIWENTLDRMLDSVIDYAADAAANFVMEEGLDFIFGSGTASALGFGGGALITPTGAMLVHVENMGGVSREMGGINSLTESANFVGALSNMFVQGSTWDDAGTAIAESFSEEVSNIDFLGDTSAVSDAFFGNVADAWTTAGSRIVAGNVDDAWTTALDEIDWAKDFEFDPGRPPSDIDTMYNDLKSWYDSAGRYYLTAAAGAVLTYSGIQSFKQDDYVGGTVQTVAGISNLYQAAAGLDLVNPIPIMDSAGRVIGVAASAYSTYAGIKDIMDNGANTYNIASTAAGTYGTVTGAAAAYTAAGAGAGAAATEGVVGGLAGGVVYAPAVAVGAMVAAGFIDSVWGSKGYGEKFYDTPTRGRIRVEEYEELGPQGSLYASLRKDFDKIKNTLIEPSSDEASRNFLENLELTDRTMAGFGNTIAGHLEILATEFDDVFAKMALAVEPTIDSFDSFIEEITGVSVSTNQATEVYNLANEATQGNVDSLNLLVGTLTDLGMESGVANVAAASLMNSFEGIPISVENAGDTLDSLSGKMMELGDTALETESDFAILARILGLDLARGLGLDIPGDKPTPIDGFADGGVLQGGSGVRDDLYLGKINGRVQIAKGGEHIMPPEQSRKYAKELEMMRTDEYAKGGLIKPVPTVNQAFNPLVGMVSTSDGGTPEKNLDRIASSVQKFNDVLASVSLSKYNDALRKTKLSYADSIKVLRELGAAQEDIDKAAAARDTELRALNDRRRDDLKSLYGSYWELNRNMSESSKWVRSLSEKYEEAIERATELGASEHQLNVMRGAQQQEIENRIGTVMGGIEDTIATSNMSNYEKSLRSINNQYDMSIEQLQDLGASQTDLQQVEHARLIEIEQLTNATEGSFTNIADVLQDIQRYSIQGFVTGSSSIVGHASGGIATSTHIMGEGGPEALMPLHAGPDTIKLMDQKLDALLQAAPIISVAVYIGNEEFEGKMKVVANNEIYKRERRQIKGQSYFKRVQ